MISEVTDLLKVVFKKAIVYEISTYAYVYPPHYWWS